MKMREPFPRAGLLLLVATAFIVATSASGYADPVITSIFRDKHLPESPHVSSRVDVTFESETGLTYDIYVSGTFNPPSWSIQSSVTATGPSTTYSDDPVVTEKYYKIGVQGTAPVTYSPNEVGVLPLAIIAKAGSEIAQLALLGVSLSPMAGNTMQDVVGWQMNGGPDPDSADEIWTYHTATSSFQFAWLFDSGGSVPTLDGMWIDPNLGDFSEEQMLLGCGFWAFSKHSEAFSIYLDGEVRRTSISHSIIGRTGASPAGHLINVGYAVPIPLNEASTTLRADGATGSNDTGTADQIWTWVQSEDSYRSAFLYVAGNPTWDGTWIEDGTPTTMTLNPGAGLWYRHKGTGNWTWTAPLPY